MTKAPFGSTPAASMLERLSALKDSSVGHGVKSQTPSLAVRPPLGTRQWDASNDPPRLMTRELATHHVVASLINAIDGVLASQRKNAH